MAVTLHTDLGDLKLELFCDKCPRTCEVCVLVTISGSFTFHHHHHHHHVIRSWHGHHSACGRRLWPFTEVQLYS